MSVIDGYFPLGGGGWGGGVEGAAQTSRCEGEVNCSDKREFGRVGLKGEERGGNGACSSQHSMSLFVFITSIQIHSFPLSVTLSIFIYLKTYTRKDITYRQTILDLSICIFTHVFIHTYKPLFTHIYT